MKSGVIKSIASRHNTSSHILLVNDWSRYVEVAGALYTASYNSQLLITPVHKLHDEELCVSSMIVIERLTIDVVTYM